jgi:phosphate transport system substrate-binding protein
MLMVQCMYRIGQLRLYLACFFLIILSSCGNEPSGSDTRDTTTSGTIHISVDESFKPVIDSQIKVFESQYPNANIIVHYKPEAECLRDLMQDSIRMVIVTRGLTRNEENILKDTLSYNPAFGPVAFDAIAVVVNNNSKDTLFTMEDIRSMSSLCSRFNIAR